MNIDAVKIGVFTMCGIRTDKNSRESASQINLGVKFTRELSDFLDTLGFCDGGRDFTSVQGFLRLCQMDPLALRQEEVSMQTV